MLRGDPAQNKPGVRIVIPEHPAQISLQDVDLAQVRRSYLRNALNSIPEGEQLCAADYDFLSEETRIPRPHMEEAIDELCGTTG